MSVEAYQQHGTWVEACAKIDPNVRGRIMAGKKVLASEYLKAQEMRKKDSTLFRELLAGYDALLTPTTQIAAVPLDSVHEETPMLERSTWPVNYYGGCAIALPMGLNAAGLPMSLQVVATADSDDTVLRIV